MWQLVAGEDDDGASVPLELVAEGSPHVVMTETSATPAMERGRRFMAGAVRRGPTAVGVCLLSKRCCCTPLRPPQTDHERTSKDVSASPHPMEASEAGGETDALGAAGLRGEGRHFCADFYTS